MVIKFSEDLVPLTDLKVNPGRVVMHTTEVHRPVLLTSRGRGVAVVQSVADYEKAQEERDFMRSVGRCRSGGSGSRARGFLRRGQSAAWPEVTPCHGQK